MQHGSNNKSAQFTDVELMTAYLWGAQQGLLTRKSVYNFIKTYHLGDFPKLPSYQAFCRRLNRLAEAFAALAEVLFEQKLAGVEPTHGYVLDCAPVTNGRLYADRAYIDADWKAHLQSERNITLITPRKRKKYDTLVSEDAVSTHVSGIRQPIEVFFNWLQAKTHIQSASHVRSCAGLLFHIFSALAFAALLLQFNY